MIEHLNTLLETIQHFFDVGIFETFETAAEYFAAFYVKASLSFKVYMLKFSFETAQLLIQQLSFDDVLITAWGTLPPHIVSIFSYLKIPESVNLILSAYMTRFVMDTLS